MDWRKTKLMDKGRISKFNKKFQNFKSDKKIKRKIYNCKYSFRRDSKESRSKN